MSKLSLLKTTIGIIGNQNANVARLIYEAHRLGIKIGIYTDKNDPAVRSADFKIIGKLNDKAHLKEFANECQTVVYVDGSGISAGLINYLRQFTNVPQGSKVLDLINDRAILRVLLDSFNIKSLPYKTVFNLDDVKQSLSDSHDPLYIQPVQTSYVHQNGVLVTDPSQLGHLSHMFNGETYLLEALPKRSRYFKLTLIKSNSGVTLLPVIEEHYQGPQLKMADLSPKVSSEVSDQFTKITDNLTSHLDYQGCLTLSLILTPDGQVYVDNVELPFELVNNIYNLTPDNLYKTFLHSVFGLPVQSKSLHQVWLLSVIDQHNLSQAQKLLSNNSSVNFDLNSLINHHKGYALMHADTLDNVKKQFKADKL
ncbi:ATP-grasp domain-containing protein [Acetilactobacillus jinshanensis]|uniref:ATP-grasp domain-containing protein n=1 Tax=Acetilactobacillus jinshanensis TaxID=1720083 RepID=UPI0013A63F02|nr:ATP-grasp domain-containing protein [Acetilactobacillus jinshanensis]URL60718.1 ATP-grasp domain-containing protein [uncultured bacterium]